MNGLRTLVMDPTGFWRSMELQLAPRPEEIKGKTVGLWDNVMWKTWGKVAQCYEELLKERYGVAHVIYLDAAKQATQRVISAGETVDDLASQCDAIILGLGN